MKKSDVAYILGAVLFVIVLGLPGLLPKNGCEVARPGYKCASAEEVIKENCRYFAGFSCDSNCSGFGGRYGCEKSGCVWVPELRECTSDISLPNVKWYISNLCEIAKSRHPGIDCSDPVEVCKRIAGVCA